MAPKRKVDLVKKEKKKKRVRKSPSESRFEVSDYFVSLNSTWAITNYVIRTRTLSESRKNVARRTFPGRNSETAIKEELNATNIVFVRTLVALQLPS